MRRGAGRVAAALGDWCDVYRADGAVEPLASRNRFLRMQAVFAPPGEGARPPGYGGATWWGSFDAAYTRVGDYIVRPPGPRGDEGGTWFIASQEEMLPVLCVRATRVVDVVRPGGAASPGANDYGGVAQAGAVPVLGQWPVSLLAAGGGNATGIDLPGGISAGSWHMLMPAVPGVVLRNGDLVRDDLGRGGVVAAAELSPLGWRVLVRQVSEGAHG